ncbi:white collar 2 protein [Spizellomyces punctatus DAOM BR117]|uniref:White collar 2 protein n=1 Tax=Spizellomyces punctatus (strain DAOM BR117) TaxID=645134 RepID=A0A0L0HSR5_SPIPD|nr:white collar 2 protein [Spizellomyces punctatus DAOM BR117]KND04143.1 white collar 2 protein [Spizellomyces punctatus DAOM BR117]|eukprot:XP_016612182.1 white collar 2 protein [Spizellomyces punctatus DAOM BR117]
MYASKVCRDSQATEHGPRTYFPDAPYTMSTSLTPTVRWSYIPYSTHLDVFASPHPSGPAPYLLRNVCSNSSEMPNELIDAQSVHIVENNPHRAPCAAEEGEGRMEWCSLVDGTLTEWMMSPAGYSKQREAERDMPSLPLANLTPQRVQPNPASIPQQQSSSSHLKHPQNRKPSISRHVSAVINHFTSVTSGPTRLLSHIDDVMHIMDPKSYTILLASDSSKSVLGIDPSQLTLKHTMHYIIHPPDWDSFTTSVHRATQSPGEVFSWWGRYKTVLDKHPTILVHVRGRVDSNSGAALLSARPYKSCAMESMDDFLELWLRNVRLRRDVGELLRGRQGEPVPAVAVEIKDERDRGHEQRRFSVDSVSRRNTYLGRRGSVTSTEGDLPTPTASSGRRKHHSRQFCQHCGTNESPEWRKGPAGPKTLCNACGLAYAKRERRKCENGETGA